jgi:proteasome assembly chaperone (PAC2) family protein
MDYSELDKKIEEMEDMLDKFKEQANHFMKEYQKDKGVDSYFR